MFCIELSLITSPVGQVFKGFLPSRQVFVGQGYVSSPMPSQPFLLIIPNSLYQSCAILGGTLMPHTIYLGSGLVQARMRDWDMANNQNVHEVKASESKFAVMLYKPTLSAIKSCMSMTIAELCITLFIVSIFVNSAILIVAAASLSEAASDADLPGMYNLFVQTIGQGAGTMFALALLFSGISAGIVATMAGQ
jgi:metal iron transporter